MEFTDLQDYVIKGNATAAQEWTERALAEGVDPLIIVNQGLVPGKDIRTALLQPEAVSLLLVGELLRPGVPTIAPRETLDVVLDRFAHHDVDSLPVASSDDQESVIGLLSRQAVIKRYQAELERQG